MKILMVCLGNICRSPLAEGVMRHKIKQAGLDWEVDSAGTAHYHVDEPPHVLSQKIARQNGIDICQQKCRQFVKQDMQRFDKIYVMDFQNYNNVKRIAAEDWDESKVNLLMNESRPTKDMNIPDPWYGEEEDYHSVYALIEEACNAIVEKYARKTTA